MAVMKGVDSFDAELFTIVGEAKDLDAVDTSDGLGRTFRQIVKNNRGIVTDVATGDIVYDSDEDDTDDDD